MLCQICTQHNSSDTWTWYRATFATLFLLSSPADIPPLPKRGILCLALLHMNTTKLLFLHFCVLYMYEWHVSEISGMGPGLWWQHNWTDLWRQRWRPRLLQVCLLIASWEVGDLRWFLVGFCSNIRFHDTRCLSMFSLRIQDHFTYLGVDMEADDWSTCRIITAQSVRQFRQELAANNIIMTEHDIDVSIVEPSVQTDWSSSR